MQNREQLVEQFKTNTVEVTFTKVTGEVATMIGTLDIMKIPQIESTNEEKTPRMVNQETLRVYSLDRQGWRSFKIANVISTKNLSN